MKGNRCVAIASDKLFSLNAQTISKTFAKTHQFSPYLFVSFPGLITDAQTVLERLRFRRNIYELKEDRKVTPIVLASMLSNLLYEKRFSPYYVEPIVAGLDSKTFEPFVCSMDMIGCRNTPSDFVVGGTATKQLYGMCEAVWEPNLSPEDLFEVISQALVNGFDRDALSGAGATIFLVEPGKITESTIVTRSD